MAELATLRNVLVHLFWKVDNRRVIQILKDDLPSVKEFWRLIGSLL
jgi:uncharacterized protein YutE (UPF0331/DUF86 family)